MTLIYTLNKIRSGKPGNWGRFLLRQSALTDLARRVCRSFIRPSVSFLVFNDGLKSSERSDFRQSFQLDSVRVAMLVY